MKKIILVLLMAGAAIFFVTGSAFSATFTYGDMYANWPGYPLPGYPVYGVDEIGDPQVGDMTIVTDANGFLTSISLEVKNRDAFVEAGFFDGLFLNSEWQQGESWENWDYFVKDTTYANGMDGATLYTVGAYTYSIRTGSGRVGHPNGIASGLTADTNGILLGVDYVNDILTYTFDPQIVLGGRFVIGWANQCANDVFLTPIPEPATMLLIGSGLIGLAGFGRRKFFRRS